MNLVDLATAIRFRVVRARDKGPADLDRVPARLHAEPERFLCLDVLWGESLHQVLSVGVRSHIESRRNLQASAARACRIQLTPLERAVCATTAVTTSRRVGSAGARE